MVALESAAKGLLDRFAASFGMGQAVVQVVRVLGFEARYPVEPVDGRPFVRALTIAADFRQCG